jgi:hypothetical protein
VRAGIDLVAQEESTGASGFDALIIDEQRTTLDLAWAPHERLSLLIGLPLIRRTMEYVNLATKRVVGVGDLELRARLTLWMDRAFSPRHLVSAIAGASLPITPAAQDAAGAPLAPELQAGTGTFAPTGGLAYAHFHYPWSEYASAVALLPINARAGARPSRSLRFTAASQRHIADWLAVQVALDARLDGAAREEGRADPNTGGAVVFASPELLLSPVADILVFGGVRVPIVQRLAGVHSAGPIWMAGVVCDF